MKTLLISIEVISGLVLIVAILLHSPKGEGLGAIGGQAQLFNAPQKDMERGLTRFTGVLALIFMVVATILGLFY